jgi:hypothetical protein
LFDASVSTSTDASLVITSLRIAAIDLRLANHCRRILVSSLVASVLSSRIARVTSDREGQPVQLVEQAGRRRGRKPVMVRTRRCAAQARFQPAGQRLIGEQRVEIHRRFGDADAMPVRRDANADRSASRRHRASGIPA